MPTTVDWLWVLAHPSLLSDEWRAVTPDELAALVRLPEWEQEQRGYDAASVRIVWREYVDAN